MYFDLQYLNTKFIFVGRQRKTSIRKIFSRIIENQIRQQGFPRSRLRFDSLSAFGASLHPTLLAINATQSFALPGKINELHPICVDYTLELISNLTADFFVNLIRKPSIIRKMPVFPDYKGNPVPANRNRRRIWILQVKIIIYLQPKALRESYRSLPQGNPAATSNILNNQKKKRIIEGFQSQPT